MATRKKKQSKGVEHLSTWRFDEVLLRRFHGWRIALRDWNSYKYIPFSYQRYDYVPGETRILGKKELEVYDLGAPERLWQKERTRDYETEWLKGEMLQFKTKPNNPRYFKHWKGVKILGEGYVGRNLRIKRRVQN